MHVYSLSLGRETEKRKEYLAVSAGSCPFPAAVQPICPFQRRVLLGVDILLLLNTFSNTPLPQYKFLQLNTTHMEMGPGPFSAFSPLPIAWKILHSAEKKCTHPVLIRLGKREGSGKAYPMEAPHMRLGEQNRQAGRHAAAFYMALVLSLWWHCLE